MTALEDVFTRELNVATLKVETAAAVRDRLIAASKLPSPEGDAERAALNFAFLDASKVGTAADAKLRSSFYLLADVLMTTDYVPTAPLCSSACCSLESRSCRNADANRCKPAIHIMMRICKLTF